MRRPSTRRVRSGLPEIDIMETGDSRALLLGSDTVQSEMNLDDPSELMLSYTRAMMGGLLFVAQPDNILHIGLGGGSMLRFCHHRLPETDNTVVELHPQVIAVARSMFQVPEDSDRLRIIAGDGIEFMATTEAQYSMILVDAFDGFEIVQDTVSEPFLHDCQQALKAGGALVLNLWGSDPRFARQLAVVQQVFDGWAFALPASTHGNIAVIALKLPVSQTTLRWDTLTERAQTLETEFGIEFEAFVTRLKAENAHTAQRLLPASV